MHRSSPPAPRAARLRPSWRWLVLLCGSTALAASLLIGSAAALPGPVPSRPAAPPPAPLDTTGTDTTRTDTTRGDSARAARNVPPARRLRSVSADPPPAAPGRQRLAGDPAGATDTTGLDSTRLVRRYLPRRGRRPAGAFLPKHRDFLGTPLGTRHALTADSLGRRYTARERTGDLDVRPPMTVDRTTYRRLRRERDLDAAWRTLADDRARQRQQRRRGGLGVNIAVPGGRSSAFSTIFGKPQVDLRVTGQADIQAGFDYRKSDQQQNVTGNTSQVDPDFQQDLRLGITGTVGDKMQVDVNWDTQSQFDYQNQVKLEYTGYEDEIIQRVEAGNVFLETPSTLIRGGQSLFGIKSELQLGPVRLTTVASQQEGQSNSLSIEGGAETQSFGVQPIDYDEDQHFFLGYYFRNRWEEAHAQPPTPLLGPGFARVTDVEVWRLRTSASLDDPEVRQVSAVVDLGEPPVVVDSAGAFTQAVPPGDDQDRYTEADFAFLRNAETGEQDVLDRFPGLGDTEYESGRFVRLERDTDYVFDDRFGYLSLGQPLQDNQALAIAFRYDTGAGTVTVGDFASEGAGSGDGTNEDRIVLKLLRPSNLSQPTPTNDPAAWYLMMRNIYSLRGGNFTEADFDLEVYYDPPASPQQSDLGNRQLLNLLGLDRVGPNGAGTPDNVFDFLPGYTINPSDGLLIFPYLQPFGRRIEEVTGDATLAFNNLYLQKKESARNDGNADLYRIAGQSKGGVPSFYDLKAFAGLVEGSVRVTAGGTPLTEGTDYTVDYQSGTVNITNQDYLSVGRNIDITYEQNSLFSIQKKTLLGARATYAPVGDRFALGTTVMRLSESSPVDKFRIGEEPIKNTIIGLDGSLDLEPRWLTRAVDALPLVQTRERSTLSVSGEVAQLRPGHTDTDAFKRTRDGLEDDGGDFRNDELGGISYIDDFEGFENTFSLASTPQNWRLSAPPQAPDAPLQTAVERSLERGLLGWYQLNRGIREKLDGDVTNLRDDAVELVDVSDVFPGREREGSVDNRVTTFDLYFDPQARGPYNYTTDLRGFLNAPENAWGGITQRLPEGYTDFSLQNVEFVEFIFRPHADAPSDSAALYVNLGTISEDVVPNGRLNNEDGLSLTSFTQSAIDEGPPRSRLPTASQQQAINVEDRRTEDLGLDGLASYVRGAEGSELYGIATEAAQFIDFLDALPQGGAGRLGAEVARAQLDPSGDDYHYYENETFFGNDAIFPGGTTLQQRLAFYNSGHELNSYEAQNRLGVGSDLGNARQPDSEKLDFSGSVNTQDSYFEYRIPLSTGELDRLAAPSETDDFVIEKIRDEGRPTGWYLVRIPVRSPRKDSIGTIDDFSTIESMRLWTAGHRAPMTLRFATLELVGSQWRESAEVFLNEETEVLPVTDESAGDAALTVSSVNNEENSAYQKPPRAIVSQNRNARGVRQRSREQSLVLQVAGVQQDQQRAIFKTNNAGYDLLKYSNLRMFTHLEGETNAELLGTDPQAQRGDVKLFVRLGANQEADYYEYELPLTPSAVGASTAEALWLDENEVNIRLSDLNELKVARDNQAPNGTAERISSDNLDLDFNDDRGERLFIRGTPSLQNVRTIVIGVRNGAGEATTVLEDVRVWVNELRSTGYDESNGWAAVANADVRLADLGRLSGNVQTQTDGFGALGSTLGERDQINRLNWGMQADLNADQLLPERYGWSLPVSFQLRSRTSTPKYAPSRGDVRLQEILDQNDARTDVPDEAIEAERQEIIEAAQTRSLQRSFTASLQKQGSSSRLLRNTLDAFSLSYSYSDTDARSPSQRANNAWNWNGTVRYRLGGLQARTVSPLGFLGGVPLLGVLGGLEFNYVPQSVSLSGGAQRSFTFEQTRDSRLAPSDGLPERRREQQTFTHDRSFDLQYSPLEFLNLSFGTQTSQSLDDISTGRRYAVFVAGEDEPIREDTFGDAFDSLEEADQFIRYNLPDTVDAYAQENLDLRSSTGVLGGIVSRDRLPRSNRYQQRFTATLRPSVLSGESLNWIDLEDITYQATYQWNNGPAGQQTGAGVRNDVAVRGGVTLHPQDLWRKFGFYRRLEEARTADREEREAADRDAPDRDAPEQQPEGEEDDPRGEAEAGGEGDDSSADADGGGFLSSLLPDPVGVLRSTFLAVTGVRDFSVTYTGARESRSSNVGRVTATDDAGRAIGVATDYTFLDLLDGGNGPSLGYRFGLSRQIDERILSEAYQVTDLFQEGNTIQARTALEPSPALRIDVDWEVDWSTGRNVTLQDGAPPRETFNGRNESSVWAFGGSYLKLFERQLETLREDVAAAGPDGTIGGEDDDQVVLTNQSLVQDFREAFAGSFSTLGGRGLLAFPMPNWSVTYTGLSDFPLLRSVTQTINLRHRYTAGFQNTYRSSTADEPAGTFTLGEGASSRTFTFRRPDFTTNSAEVSERYQPLLGVDVSWKGGVSTNVEWNRTNLFTLSTTQSSLTTNRANEVKLTARFQKQGLTIPLLPLGRLNNRISFTLSLSRAVNTELEYFVRDALSQALAAEGGPDAFDPQDALEGETNVSTNSKTQRIAVTPKISYQFSNRVSADFLLQYENFDGGSRRPSYTNVNSGFNVRVSVSN